MRDEHSKQRRALSALDPFDPHLAQKAAVLTAKMKAIKGLARRFYEVAGLDGAKGEEAVDG
jgi:hypothetical protein